MFKKASLFPVFKHLLLAFSTREPNFLLFITVLLKRAVLYLLCVSSLHMTLETWCRVHTPVFLEKLPRDILVAKSTGTSVSLSFIFTSPIHLMLLTIPCLKFSSSLVSVLWCHPASYLHCLTSYFSSLNLNPQVSPHFLFWRIPPISFSSDIFSWPQQLYFSCYLLTRVPVPFYNIRLVKISPPVNTQCWWKGRKMQFSCTLAVV